MTKGNLRRCRKEAVESFFTSVYKLFKLDHIWNVWTKEIYNYKISTILPKVYSKSWWGALPWNEKAYNMFVWDQAQQQKSTKGTEEELSLSRVIIMWSRK